jgi:membrane-bound inhibitor of C-type lysozyme/heat shock protein HslJ
MKVVGHVRDLYHENRSLIGIGTYQSNVRRKLREMKLNLTSWGILIGLSVFLAACTVVPVAEDTTPAAATEPGPAETSPAGGALLSEEQLGNASFSGIYTDTVTLSDGVYEGEPFVEGGAARPHVELIEGSAVYGDLDGDGVDDAAVLLVESSGGSGVFTYVGAQLNQDGEPVDAGTVLLGDRTQVAAMTVEDGQITVDIVTPGPDDPLCCGTLKVHKTLALQEGLLAEVGSEEMGNVSLADLDGTNWMLTQLNFDQPALPDVSVTLSFTTGQLSGNGGCNSYSGGVSSEGGQTLAVGEIAATQMACPAPILDQETAYLSALQAASNWSYFNSGLAINYQTEAGEFGSLLFTSAPGDEATGASSPAETGAAETIEATFVCPDGTSIPAVFDNTADTVTVTLPDGAVTLPQVVSGSGARYSDGVITFWNKGDEALVEVNGEIVYEACVAQ